MLRNLISGARRATRRAQNRLPIHRLLLVGLATLLLTAGAVLSGPVNLAAQDENGAAMSLDKAITDFDDVDGDGALGEGDSITYTFVIANSGEVSLEDITLDDELLGLAGVTCGVDALEPGESTTCDYVYTITQADMNAGEIANQAIATGMDPNGAEVSAEDGATISGLDAPADMDEEMVEELDEEGDDEAGEDQAENEVSAEDEEIVEITQSPDIALGKSFTDFEDVDENGQLGVGDILSYTFTITNTGNVTLSTITLDDELLELEAMTCGESTLAPEESASCVFTYTVSEDDILAGEIVNQATVTGLAPDEEPVSAEAEETVEIPQNPGIALGKAYTGFEDLDDNGELSLGDVITYSFTITNTGNVLLNPVTLDDPMLGLDAATCGESSLEPGETTSCDHTYTITQDDVDAGEIHNQAAVIGVVPE